MLKFLRTDSEFILGFFSFNESLLQHDQVFDEKPLIYMKIREIYKKLLGFIKTYWDLYEIYRDLLFDCFQNKLRAISCNAVFELNNLCFN